MENDHGQEKDWIGEMKKQKKNGDFYWESVIISPNE